MQNLRSLLLEIPKAEIHLHLEAVASVDTIWELMQKHDISYGGVSKKADLRKKFDVTSLDDFIDLFINIVQNCFREDEDIEYLLLDAKDYLKRNNITYAEIFFSPTIFMKNGLKFEEMIKRLDAGASKIETEDNIEIYFIIDVSRTFGVKNAVQNLELTLANRVKHVIGIGLGGAEETGPAKEFKKIFDKAIKNKLDVVAHAGEVVGPESIWDALKHLKAKRIGHGISAIQDDELMSYLADKQIPIEVCPTSNLFTQKYVKKLKDHPIRQFFDRGLKVTVNTDDPTLFGIDLVDEYMRLANQNFFSAAELIQIAKNGIYSTFRPKKQQNAHWAEAEKIIQKYRSSLDLP